MQLKKNLMTCDFPIERNYFLSIIIHLHMLILIENGKEAKGLKVLGKSLVGLRKALGLSF